ncbi:cellulose binding domain-containing protein [Actinoplanes sp. NPDC049599]|uniref:cellulose binding domain-containing protein n=1 Tax=Actinoplanes sp. NPDC049599 TaxID=3363903 RepID=UPI0037A297C3
MTETPRPRPSRGVMGYVAELQQFDPVPPYVYELTPTGAPPPAPVPVAPRAPAVTVVSHIRQQSQRRIRAAMIAGAALVIVAGAGLAYAGLRGPHDASRARATGAVASGSPAEGSLPLDPALPGADPVTGRTTPATTSAVLPAGGSTGTTDQLPGGKAPPAPPVPPGRPGPVPPAPVATSVPTDPGDPATTEPPAAPLPLAATFSHVADAAGDGFLGYAGTVRITNPGSRDVTGWRVTLSVPGDHPVTASGATVARDGEIVTFTPDGDPTVPAGGAVSFSFEVAGLLAALPGDCVIDGVACS